jgi:hypothetical protein
LFIDSNSILFIIFLSIGYYPIDLAERFKDGHDALQKYCGCLAHIYTEDGTVYQRQWRVEWDREWDK